MQKKQKIKYKGLISLFVYRKCKIKKKNKLKIHESSDPKK